VENLEICDNRSFRQKLRFYCGTTRLITPLSPARHWSLAPRARWIQSA